MPEESGNEDRVSRAAHDRIRLERDDLKTQLDRATSALHEANRRFQIQEALHERGIPLDKAQWAPMSVVHAEADTFGEAVDQWVSGAGLIQTSPPPEQLPEPEPARPKPPAVAAPNPAAEGTQIKERLSLDEWVKANPNAKVADVRQAVKSGKINAFSPSNPYAARVARPE